MSFSLEQLQASVGRAFPGGEYVIEPWRAWLAQDAMLAPTQGDFAQGVEAHPVFVYFAAIGAMGIGWDELFAWFGASAADGPMFGECAVHVEHPLAVGARYRVDGAIVSAERKQGRSGCFDLVGYAFTLTDGAGRIAATCRNSIVFPRRDV